MSAVAHARQLLAAGEPARAVQELERSGAAGEAASWLELALWFLSGRQVPRDLARARDYFRKAGEAGDPTGMNIYISLVAIGVAGKPEWSAALDLLRSFARSDGTAATQLRLIDHMGLSRSGDPQLPAAKRAISERPDVWTLDTFFTPEECDYLVRRARPMLQPSTVVDPQSGRLIPHPVRTSHGVSFPWVSEDLVIHALNRRIAGASGTDAGAGELLQVLRYAPGQEFRPHFDSFDAGDNQRVFTMLVYLNDGYEGGETLFTHNGLKVAGRAGDGLLFRNADELGRRDHTTQHAGLPVRSGEKFLASRWIRQRPIELS